MVARRKTKILTNGGKSCAKMLDNINPDEASQILATLLQENPELSQRAQQMAGAMIAEVDIEAIVEEVFIALCSVGTEDLYDRAGRHHSGYVEPCEAAWELLDEAFTGTIVKMERQASQGFVDAAIGTCVGIVRGLYKFEKEDGGTSDVLGWSPDFPAESAGVTVDRLFDKCRKGQRKKIGSKLYKLIAPHAPEWLDWLSSKYEQI